MVSVTNTSAKDVSNKMATVAEGVKAEYDLTQLQAPRLTGRYLRLTSYLASTSLNPYIYGLISKRTNLAKVLSDVSYPDAPKLSVVPSTAAKEKVPTVNVAAGGPLERLEAAIKSLGEHGLSTGCCTSDMVRPTIRDYHWIYAHAHVDPATAADRIIEFLDKENPKMHWMATYNPEDIRKQAAASAARFAAGKPLSVLDGVPFVVKDNIDALPYPSAHGTAFGDAWAPVKEDSPTVAALKAGGAVLIGKAAMQELGLMPFGINAKQGTPLHPQEAGRMCGGSSAGCAAMVAAGVVPFAIASDGGGSIRVPAGLCGVVGLMPTQGRFAEDSVAKGGYSSLNTSGVIAFTAADAEIVYAAAASPKPVAPAAAPAALCPEGVVPAAPATAPLVLPTTLCPWKYNSRDAVVEAKPLTGLRVGVYKKWFTDAESAVLAQSKRVLNQFSELGATVVEVAVPELEAMSVAHQASFCAEMVEDNKWILDKPDLAAQLNADSALFLHTVKNVTPAQYAAAQRIRARAAKHFEALFQQVDLVVTPTTPCLAPLLPADAADCGVFDLGLATSLIRFTQPANLLGLPAITLPIGRPNTGSSGLPASMQLMGRHWEEATLLAVAAALEQQLEDIFIPKPLPFLHTNPIFMESHPVAAEIAAQIMAVKSRPQGVKDMVSDSIFG